MDFINHGENTTFKLTDSKNKKYLVRVKRFDYHTKPALLEELKWLEKLSRVKDINVQRPIKNKRDEFLTKVFYNKENNYRFVDILTWEEGRMKSIRTLKDYYRIGQLTAKLQKNSIKSKHRNYWDADGLIGKKPTFLSIDSFKETFSKAYKKIEHARKIVHKDLKKYQRNNPEKLNFIHADLHFGNMLFTKNGVTPIDFDDCGYGFNMYDLAITFSSSSYFFKNIGKKKAYECKESLFSGYTSVLNLDQDDIQSIDKFILARYIMMTGWLYQRRDNPRLFDYFKKNIDKKANEIEKLSRKLYS